MAKKTARHAPEVVAVINTSPDTVDLMRLVRQQAGFTVVTGYVHDIRSGHLDFESFIRQHDPAAIVWDIAVPAAHALRSLRTFWCGHCSSADLWLG